MKTNILLAITMTMLLLTSCTHKDLDFPEGNSQLEVFFNWSLVPDAQPDGMLLTLFSGSSQPVSFHFANPEGGSLMVPSKNYGMIAYNDNIENLQTRGSIWNDFEIFAVPTVMTSISQMFASTRNIPKAPGTENQQIISEPDFLWVSACKDVDVKGGKTITMQMKSSTIIFPFSITGVENIGQITNIAASISGMSGSCYPASGTISAPDCIIPFELKSDGVSTIYGQVRTFGHSDDEPADTRHILVVYFQTADNSKYYVPIDVTDGIHKWILQHPPGGGQTPDDSYIEITDFSIPEPIGEDSGLQPAVDEWKEIDINIRM